MADMHARSDETRGHGWVVRWALLTGVAACAATLADAVLLERRRGYFTGGFLAADQVTSAAQAVAFFAGSLLADAAVLGIVIALVLWGAARAGARAIPACAAALVVALTPVMAVNVVEYRLASFLGDAFDLALMFDLAGRSPAEIWAVSSAHLGSLAGIAGGALVVGGGLFWAMLWLVRRRAAGPGARMDRVAWRRALVAPAVLLLAGTIGTTVLRSSSDVLDNGLRRKPSGRFLGSIVTTLSDVDRDGYGVMGRPRDSHPFDARIHPYALDLPGNGIDENGVGGDLPAGASYQEPPIASGRAWQATPDVVLIVLESFRADVVGASHGGRSATPVLDALAGRGVAVGHAYSHNGYTVQSRRHIFSGSVADIRGDSTLVDDFRANGYETAYFSGQDESFGGPGQGVGFDRVDVAYDARADRDRRYSTFTTAGSLAVPYGVLNERVAAFLHGRHGDRPLFLYVNYHDTHFPYHHRFIEPLVGTTVLAAAQIVPSRAAELRAMYLNTVSNVDRAIGDLLATVRGTTGAEPGVIVLADHGESLFDEGFLGHGYALNDAQTRIPLVVANLPLEVPEPFGQADLRVGLNAALGAPADPGRGPAVRRDDTRAVFQYLGLLERPAQIAFTTMQGRTIYDFRSDRVLLDGTWRRPADLQGAEHGRFAALVHFWERMLLARREAARPAAE